MTTSDKKLKITEKLAVLLLLAQASYGRYALSEKIGLSEYKTRELLEAMVQMGFAEAGSGRGGTKITQEGRSLVKMLQEFSYLDFGAKMVKYDLSFISDEHRQSKIALFLKVDELETSGMYERDLSIIAGARGAITMSKKGDAWTIPPDNRSVELVISDPNFSLYNTLCIIFGETHSAVLSAAVKILIHHQDDVKNLLEQKFNS